MDVWEPFGLLSEFRALLLDRNYARGERFKISAAKDGVRFRFAGVQTVYTINGRTWQQHRATDICVTIARYQPGELTIYTRQHDRHLQTCPLNGLNGDCASHKIRTTRHVFRSGWLAIIIKLSCKKQKSPLIAWYTVEQFASLLGPVHWTWSLKSEFRSC